VLLSARHVQVPTDAAKLVSTSSAIAALSSSGTSKQGTHRSVDGATARHTQVENLTGAEPDSPGAQQDAANIQFDCCQPGQLAGNLDALDIRAGAMLRLRRQKVCGQLAVVRQAKLPRQLPPRLP
jgi:hypothetical protein